MTPWDAAAVHRVTARPERALGLATSRTVAVHIVPFPDATALPLNLDLDLDVQRCWRCSNAARVSGAFPADVA